MHNLKLVYWYIDSNIKCDGEEYKEIFSVGCEALVEAFYKFDNDMCIPKSHSGRTSSCYIDYETKGEIIDYLGNKGTYHELTSVHMEQTEYNLSITSAYINYFLKIQNDNRR